MGSAAHIDAALRESAAHVLLSDQALLDADLIVASDDVAHHLHRVLRLRGGQPVSVTDGAGRWRITEVVYRRDSVELAATGPITVETRPRVITIAAAIPKGDRLDWMVQKLTEVGVAKVVLIDTERSTTRWSAERVPKQLARLRRIADEASRQSRRVWAVDIEGPVSAAEVLGGAVAAEPGGRDLQAGDTTIAIGPEGGWTEAELAIAGDRVALTSAILRTETAAIAAALLALRG